MNKHSSPAYDDEDGNCKRCGHPFDPHVIFANDQNDLTKGGELLCQVADCDCFQKLSFDLSDVEWTKKLNSLLKPPS
ncbi:MAG TPA: hypothetical protein VLV88_04165 [Terriglobales bacterium]|nr:hypothetical protein [Terriglobales bacterium]